MPHDRSERVALVEPERVMRLRVDIDADDLEPGPVVAHPGTARPAEQVEEARLHDAP
jgi:hypothetical protein